MVTPSASTAATNCSSLMACCQGVDVLYPASRQICTPDLVLFSGCRSTASNRCCGLDQAGSDGTGSAAALALCILVLPFLSLAFVSVLAVLIDQMDVGLDGRHDAGVSQSLLHKFPVHGFAVLEI